MGMTGTLTAFTTLVVFGFLAMIVLGMI